MNTASLELSKELYELSAWDDTSHVLNHGYNFGNEQPMYLAHKDEHYLPGIGLPAYDLGYLLRKLPTPFDLEGVLGEEGTEWAYRASCDALETVDEIDMFYAATPEDAACKLAIGLFKQGVLRKGERNE